MNVFELSPLFSPIAGAIAGGMSVRSSGAIWMVLGICIGLAIGLALYFAAIGLSNLLARVPGVSTKTEGLSPLEWLASMSAVLLPAASPFAAWALSTFVIARLLHL